MSAFMLNVISLNLSCKYFEIVGTYLNSGSMNSMLCLHKGWLAFILQWINLRSLECNFFCYILCSIALLINIASW